MSRSNNDPSNPIIEDVYDNQQNNRRSSTPPPKGNVEEPPEVNLEETTTHNPTPGKEKKTENIENKNNPIV